MDTLKQSIILFDLDGTLTDSEEGIIRSTQYMQEKMGQRIWSAEELHFIVGPPLIQSFTKEFGMAQEMAEKAVAIFRERYATIGLFENSVFPGVVELLQALRKKGKRLAVATSKKEDWSILKLRTILRSSAVTGERSAGTIRRRSLIMCWRPCRRRKTMSS